jgi:hypothetical protein
MDFIGDWRCKNNALDSNLRCAINPYGPCEGCADFEKVRERLMFQGNLIASMSKQEMLAHKLKMKVFDVWSVARFPTRMLVNVCGIAFLVILLANKYPISKDETFLIFKDSINIVVIVKSLYELFDLLKNQDEPRKNQVWILLRPYFCGWLFALVADLLMHN